MPGDLQRLMFGSPQTLVDPGIEEGGAILS